MPKMTIGTSTLTVVESRRDPSRSRILLDMRTCRLRARTLVADDTYGKSERVVPEWVEGDDADLSALVRCLESKKTNRTEADGRVVLVLDFAGLSGVSTTTKATVRIDEGGVVEVDMERITHELDPYFGW